MQGEKNSKSLTIYVNYAGLGDNLFYSHLPRIAKSSNGGGGLMIKSLSSLILNFATMITKG